MGDVVSLVEKAQESFDEESAKALEEKIKNNQFDFDDFAIQIKQFNKLGSISEISKFIPGIKNVNKFNLDEYGMIIVVNENKIVVDALKWNGLAKKAGFETGDFISELKIENLDRPSKKIIYPLAILLLLIFGYLNYRRKK